MSRKRPNPHKPFMVFNAVLFLAVLGVTAIFLYMAYNFKRDLDRVRTYEGQYRIEISPDFSGESLSVYLNDSLLVQGTMPDTLTGIDIHRFAEENTLLVVEGRTDNTTPFNLSKDGGKVSIRKSEGKILIEETPIRLR